MLRMTGRTMRRSAFKSTLLATSLLASLAAFAAAASAQDAHPPFLQRDVPPTTGWHFDGRDDTRDFQNNGFFQGDFAARPGSAWLGAAGVIGFTPSGGSHFGAIYCNRAYRHHNPRPGYFQGEDGVWYRCHR
jgi:hypothetical protein